MPGNGLMKFFVDGPKIVGRRTVMVGTPRVHVYVYAGAPPHVRLARAPGGRPVFLSFPLHSPKERGSGGEGNENRAACHHADSGGDPSGAERGAEPNHGSERAVRFSLFVHLQSLSDVLKFCE